MKTLYAACLSRLGMSLAEAARLHDVRLDTVKSWSSGRNPVPQGAWDDLRAREAGFANCADEMLEAWEVAGCPAVEIDDSEGGLESLMAAADFLLNTHGSVSTCRTPATREARRFR